MSVLDWDELAARNWQMYRHWAAAVSEGLCPVHCIQLEAAAAADSRIAGFCAACRGWWWSRQETQEAGWSRAITCWNSNTTLFPDWLA